MVRADLAIRIRIVWGLGRHSDGSPIPGVIFYLPHPIGRYLLKEARSTGYLQIVLLLPALIAAANQSG